MSLVSKIKNEIQEAEKKIIRCNAHLLEAVEREDEPSCCYWKAKEANAQGKITALNDVLDWIEWNIIKE